VVTVTAGLAFPCLRPGVPGRVGLPRPTGQGGGCGRNNSRRGWHGQQHDRCRDERSSGPH
jgi:hypothetical protein